MRSLGYMPNEVELEVIIQRLDMDGERCPVSHPSTGGLGPEPRGLSLPPLPATPKPISLQLVWPRFPAWRTWRAEASVTAPATPSG